MAKGTLSESRFWLFLRHFPLASIGSARVCFALDHLLSGTRMPTSRRFRHLQSGNSNAPATPPSCGLVNAVKATQTATLFFCLKVQTVQSVRWPPSQSRKCFQSDDPPSKLLTEEHPELRSQFFPMVSWRGMRIYTSRGILSFIDTRRFRVEVLSLLWCIVFGKDRRK